MPADDTPDLDLPRGIALAWGVAASPQRGPKREMSVERIVETAVEIADDKGLAAVSMSSVASALGFTPMSLYRYVSAKDDLLVLMFEEGVGIPPEHVRETDDWREALTRLYAAESEVFERHPWLLDIPVAGVTITPNNLAWMDAGLHALAGTKLTPTERVAATLMLAGHVRWKASVTRAYAEAARAAMGFVRSPTRGTASPLGSRSTSADADAGWTDEAGLLQALITADQFPDLEPLARAGVFRSDDDPFAWGLDRLLDGLGAVIAAREADDATSAPAASWPEPEPEHVRRDSKLKEAQRRTREAEKQLREARRDERQALREARERHTNK
jgi:AcrR family transcriptional regulator